MTAGPFIGAWMRIRGYFLLLRKLMDGAHVRTLQQALEILGNKERLAIVLGVRIQDLENYLIGNEPLPQQTFLDALDIVATG